MKAKHYMGKDAQHLDSGRLSVPEAPGARHQTGFFRQNPLNSNMTDGAGPFAPLRPGQTGAIFAV
ncbi:MAG: hypothetical protein D6722_17900 [Bacteroidetes bacterium]|nr:MAG: hypothetical protein D6722_17900 [Bacteroidota bacterium]